MCGKRSQSALEFLTTYAWGFVAILVLIGGITYYTITQPNSMIQESCISESSVVCLEAGAFKSSSGDFVQVNLRNKVGYPVSVTGVHLSTMDVDGGNCTVHEDDVYIVSMDGSLDLLRTNVANLDSYDELFLRFYCDDSGFVKGAVTKFKFDVIYTDSRADHFPKNSAVEAQVKGVLGEGGRPRETPNLSAKILGAFNDECSFDIDCVSGSCINNFCQ